MLQVRIEFHARFSKLAIAHCRPTLGGDLPVRSEVSCRDCLRVARILHQLSSGRGWGVLDQLGLQVAGIVSAVVRRLEDRESLLRFLLRELAPSRMQASLKRQTGSRVSAAAMCEPPLFFPLFFRVPHPRFKRSGIRSISSLRWILGGILGLLHC